MNIDLRYGLSLDLDPDIVSSSSPRYIQVHTLSLPGMVLRGEGDATDGCLRAVGEVAAAASRRGGGGEGGGGRLQVILLPRVEVTEGGHSRRE